MRLQARLAEVEAAGGRIVAISVDSRETSKTFLEEFVREEGGKPIAFPVLADRGGATAKAYGVYDADAEIALPATFVVGRDGSIVWQHVGDTIADRAAEDEIIAALKTAGPMTRRK